MNTIRRRIDLRVYLGLVLLSEQFKSSYAWIKIPILRQQTIPSYHSLAGNFLKKNFQSPTFDLRTEKRPLETETFWKK